MARDPFAEHADRIARAGVTAAITELCLAAVAAQRIRQPELAAELVARIHTDHGSEGAGEAAGTLAAIAIQWLAHDCQPGGRVRIALGGRPDDQADELTAIAELVSDLLTGVLTSDADLLAHATVQLATPGVATAALLVMVKVVVDQLDQAADVAARAECALHDIAAAVAPR